MADNLVTYAPVTDNQNADFLMLYYRLMSPRNQIAQETLIGSIGNSALALVADTPHALNIFDHGKAVEVLQELVGRLYNSHRNAPFRANGDDNSSPLTFAL